MKSLNMKRREIENIANSTIIAGKLGKIRKKG